MSDLADEKLPDDVPACHNLIKELRLKVANLRRVVVGALGYDPTDTAAVFGYNQAMSRALKTVKAEEKARREARRKKK
jgi:hypothetical protein